jgi:hypothetical protein
MMTRARAAHYCDLTEPEFEREVASGRLPMPTRLGNRDHWDRKALDEHLERLSGERGPDWRANSPLYGGRNAA